MAALASANGEERVEVAAAIEKGEDNELKFKVLGLLVLKRKIGKVNLNR